MSWRTGLLLPLLTAILLSALPERAAQGQPDKQPPKLDPAGVDKLVDTTLRDVLMRGVPLYNNGDFDGSYRLYEGSLMAVKPLLGHRPNLQKDIEGALIIADRTAEMPKRAWVLRETMDKIRTEVKGTKTVPVEPPTPVVGSVNGLVSVEREILAAGTVTLIGADNKALASAIDKGKYEIKAVPAGEYRVIISEDAKAKGQIEARYLDVKTTPLTVKVVDKSPVTFNIGLKAAEVKVVLGSITGKVTLDGMPFEGAKVVASLPGVGAKIAIVGKDGTYSFDKLKLGAYKLHVPADQGGPMFDPKVQELETTPYRVEVKDDKAVRFDISLKTEKKITAIKLERLNVSPSEVVKVPERRLEPLKVAPTEVKVEVKPEVKPEVKAPTERRPETLKVEPAEFVKPKPIPVQALPELIKEAPREKQT